MNPKLKRALAVLGMVAVFAAMGLVLSRGRPAAKTEAIAPRSPELEKCLTLEHWSWTPSANGELVEVTADVRAGIETTLALDVVANRDNREVFQPSVLTGKLARVEAQPGQLVHLTRSLRRVGAGDPDWTLLRFSCRPKGPQGVFGVIEYAKGKPPPDLDAIPAPRPLP